MSFNPKKFELLREPDPDAPATPPPSPTGDYHALPKEGKILLTEPMHWRPDRKWLIRKDIIRDKSIALDAERFEKIVINATPVHQRGFIPVVLATYQIDLFQAVDHIPFDIRLLVMARIMNVLDIPDPINPKSGTRYFPQREKPQPTFTIDINGNSWKWNCGWYRINDKGERKDAKAPLGHTTFRRSIKLATPESLGLTTFKYSRPNGLWRRANGKINHPLFGNGLMEMTDGMHAIILFDDGVRREVMYENTRTIGVATRRVNPKTGETTEVKAKTASKKIQNILNSLEGII